jgi:hypothetical protein
MPMSQPWFEMAEIRRRRLTTAVWIPLRANVHIETVGAYGKLGFHDGFLGVGSLAVAVGDRARAEELDWTDIGLMRDHHAWVGDDGRYVAADVYEVRAGDVLGMALALSQHTGSSHPSVWHLHQDLVIALHLIREGDDWIRPEEDYIQVARLRRAPDGTPLVLEINSELLRDYLCARGMGLRVVSYQKREEVVEDRSHITWASNPIEQRSGGDRWQGRVREIHEGGMPYGEEWAVFHMGRTDVDPDEDVPEFRMSEDADIASSSWKTKMQGRRLFAVEGELWREEWIEPGGSSPRVRRDHAAPSVSFVTDAAGTKETRETLEHTSRWLWFKPDVVPALLRHRGGALAWYTHDTGAVGCSPGDLVHFGVNKVGLVNVFAKDIVQLAEWQQRIWAGHNVAPESGVSEELLASQMAAKPARTTAPETRLRDALERLNDEVRNALGAPLFREHEKAEAILREAHRFRALDEPGLFGLAKDLARLTADRIDAAMLQKVKAPPKGERLASLLTPA